MSLRYGNRSRVSDRISSFSKPASYFNPSPKTVQIVSTAVTVTAGATSHTKGAWTQLIASTSSQANCLRLQVFTNQSGVATEGLIDIALGASGAETVIISNAVGGAINSSFQSTIADQVFFVDIPAGSRISARTQNVVGSRNANVYIGLSFIDKTFSSFVDTYGADTTTSRGIPLPNSNIYVEVTGSTINTYQALMLMPKTSGSTVAALGTTLTLAVGDPGSEVEVGSLEVVYDGQEYAAYRFGQEMPVFWGHFPIGSRLAVKIANGASNREVLVFGIPYS